MSYLETLIQLKDAVGSSNLQPNHKIILIDLVEKQRSSSSAKKEPFVYFYKNILKNEHIFEFSKVLLTYDEAKGHATTCISIFDDFASMKEDRRLHSWLQSAIRVVDCIVIHYLQEILNEMPTQQGDSGKERSRYIQINRKGVKAEKAGRIMDQLYKERNKLEHATKTDPNDPKKQIIIPPNFSQIKKKIHKNFPQALENFNVAFIDHYS